MSDDRAAQVRAAQAWADLTDDELAAKIGVSKRTLSRFKSGAEVSYERRLAIAGATGVPGWFLEDGFEGATGPEEPALGERVEALEAQMHTMLDIALNRIGPDLADTLARSASGEASADAEGTGRQGRRRRAAGP